MLTPTITHLPIMNGNNLYWLFLIASTIDMVAEIIQETMTTDISIITFWPSPKARVYHHTIHPKKIVSNNTMTVT